MTNENFTHFPLLFFYCTHKMEHKKCLKQQITIKTDIKITQVQITEKNVMARCIEDTPKQTHTKFYIVIFFNVLLFS